MYLYLVDLLKSEIWIILKDVLIFIKCHQLFLDSVDTLLLPIH